VLVKVKESVGPEGKHQHMMRDRLDLLAAAQAHVLWKNRLEHCVRGDEPLETVFIGQKGVCKLGNWINGPVFRSYCDQNEYRQLTEAHQQFHRCSDLIIEKLKSGDREGAGTIFSNEYSQSLRSIIHSLTEINRQL